VRANDSNTAPSQKEPKTLEENRPTSDDKSPAFNMECLDRELSSIQKRGTRDEDSVPDINYGTTVLPKKFILLKKKPTKASIVEEKSVAEIKKQVDELYGDL
jgi:hypothetical protein